MLFHQPLHGIPAVCRRQEFFCQQPFQTGVVQHGIRQKALQLGILGFKILQAAQL